MPGVFVGEGALRASRSAERRSSLGMCLRLQCIQGDAARGILHQLRDGAEILVTMDLPEPDLQKLKGWADKIHYGPQRHPDLLHNSMIMLRLAYELGYKAAQCQPSSSPALPSS